MMMYGRERPRGTASRIRHWSGRIKLSHGLLLLIGLSVGYMLHGNSNLSSGATPPTRPGTPLAPAHTEAAAAQAPPRADGVLVLYSFALTDELSLGNLRFFVANAMREGDGAEYAVIVNLGPQETLASLALPDLPANGRYMHHANECYDWGTYAWALDELGADSVASYKYFVFINSSVRGPLLPVYARKAIHWTSLFTGKLNDSVKLVGPAISCENFCVHPGTCRQTPHVQSVAVATDQVGLGALREARTVLACHAGRNEAVYDGEMGSSYAILQAGFNIDSFLTRYQGVDWRLAENKKCNAETSPIGNYMMDGVTLSAYELVFPKLKASLLDAQMPSHVEASKLSAWMSSLPAARHLEANWLLKEGQGVLAAEVLIAKTKGSECFDWDYYLKKNADLVATGMSRAKMFDHFLARGMLEYREHRWTCGLDASKIIPKWP